MKKMMFVLSLSTLPMVASADGVGSLYSQISRLCQTDSQKNGNPLTQVPAFKNPNMLDKGISDAFEKAKKANSHLLDDSTSCIEAVSKRYRQDNPGKTLPVS
ncbi:hypothetical protein [Erwinia tasmaniensis]|nr:hypothetical protein [Erwinia tasmaniensis]